MNRPRLLPETCASHSSPTYPPENTAAPFASQKPASNCRVPGISIESCRSEIRSFPDTAEQKMECPECGPSDNGSQKYVSPARGRHRPRPGGCQASAARCRNPE